MNLRTLSISVLAIVLASATASAQVVADLVAAPGIPAGNAAAPHTPSGMLIIANNIWVGDEAQGLRHYIPVDPANTDPLNTGKLQFDINTEWSVGGGSCFLWCSAGRWHRTAPLEPTPQSTITRKANPEILAALACG